MSHINIIKKLLLVSESYSVERVVIRPFHASGGKCKANARRKTPALPFARNSPFTRACLALVRASEISETWSEICAVSLNATC